MRRSAQLLASTIMVAACTSSAVDARRERAPQVKISDAFAVENATVVPFTLTRTGSTSAASCIAYRTINSSAIAGSDYEAQTGRICWGIGETLKSLGIRIIRDTVLEPDEKFTVKISAVSNVKISDSSGTGTIKNFVEVTVPDPEPEPEAPPETQTCDDGTVIPAEDTCPEPPPPEDPQPSTDPEFPGTEAIASNFTVSTALQAAGVPAVNSSDRVGAFRFICGAGQLLYDDPVVSPGDPGAAHLHQFYGNNLANANSTFATLRGTGGSTCNNVLPGLTTAANRSAYWMPAMLDGKGHVVEPDYIQVYYKREPLFDPHPLAVDGPYSNCDPNNPNKYGICIGIPNGLKFISGFKMSDGTTTQPGWFRCGTGPVWKANVEGMGQANSATCPVGKQLEMTVASMKCWNGSLDSTDHISHLALQLRNSTTGKLKCPATHPYYLPQFTISAFFSIKAGDDVGLWKLSSDAMYPARPRGSTLHFDYFEAWDFTVKEMWMDGCINSKLNCSAGNTGSGFSLKNASVPFYNGASSWTNPNHLVAIPVNPSP